MHLIPDKIFKLDHIYFQILIANSFFKLYNVVLFLLTYLDKKLVQFAIDCYRKTHRIAFFEPVFTPYVLAC